MLQKGKVGVITT